MDAAFISNLPQEVIERAMQNLPCSGDELTSEADRRLWQFFAAEIRERRSSSKADLGIEQSQSNVEQHVSENIVSFAPSIYESLEAMALTENLPEGIKECGYEKQSAVQQREVIFGKVAESEPGRTSAIQVKRSESNVEQYDSEKSVISATQVYGTFEAMNLKENLLKGINEYGYAKPSAVQQRAIVPLYQGSDVFVQVAAIEPGKIAALCIWILQQVDCAFDKCQALVVASSFEASVEIGKAMRALGGWLVGVHVVVGPYFDLVPLLRQEWGPFQRENIKVVFFYEPKYTPQIMVARIFRRLPSWPAACKVCVFSEERVQKFRKVWMPNHVEVTVPQSLQLERNAKHQVLSVVEKVEWKPRTLLNLCNHIEGRIVVFANQTKTIDLLAKLFKEHKVDVFFTRKYIDQKAKNKISRELFEDVCDRRVLITNEGGVDGIDLKQVRLLVNYDLPWSLPESYLERVSRFGEGADVINFVTGQQWSMLFDIQKHFKNDVVFEGCFLQPCQIGPAGFSDQLPEGLEFLKKQPMPETSKDIHHIVFQVEEEEDDDDETKLSVVCSLLSEKLAKTKSVIFVNTPPKVDHQKVLGERFNVFTMENLQEFFQCEEPCVLLVTTDLDALYDHAYAKVPVVINFDLPVASDLYPHRIAWCKAGGAVIHLASENDWLKLVRMSRK